MSSSSVSGDYSSIIMHKKALRKEIKATLKTLSLNNIAEQSEKIKNQLLGLGQFQNAQNVSIYLSMPKEVQTYPILQEMLNQQKRVCIPCVTGKERGDMKMMPLVSIDEYNGFKMSNWGIPEPELDLVNSRDDMATSGDLDLVLMPGCAFDLNRNRLGHGKGYYDTFLEKVFAANEAKGKPRPALVALALEEQVLGAGAALPTAAHDVRVDMIITPNFIVTEEGHLLPQQHQEVATNDGEVETKKSTVEDRQGSNETSNAKRRKTEQSGVGEEESDSKNASTVAA